MYIVIKSSSIIIIISFWFTKKLGFEILYIYVYIKNIYNHSFNIVEMKQWYSKLMNNEKKKFYFFEKILLLTNFGMNIILQVLFFILNNI